MPFLSYVQFPWRLMVLLMFFGSILFAFISEKLPKYFKIAAVAFLIFSALPFTTPFKWDKKANTMYLEFPFTSSTKHENMPKWFGWENHLKFDKLLFADRGELQFEILKRKTNRHVYKVKVEEDSRLIERTAYFPGWQVEVDGEKVSIVYDDHHYPGLITFDLEKGEHIVEVSLGERTWPRIVGDIISTVAFVVLIVVVKFAL